MGSALGSIAGSAVSSVISGKGRKKAGRTAGLLLPPKVSTGRSSILRDPKGVDISIDPSIREGQESFLQSVRGLRGDAVGAFDEFREGLGGLRGEVSGLRADYEGNQSAFREATLNPLRENIATRRGGLEKELGRTGVRGSFANQARDTFELAAGRELTDAEAVVENQRINNLGNLLNMDAGLLKAGLTSEQGRTQLMLQLEQALQGISMDRFNQEMQLLGLPAQYQPGAAGAAGLISNAQGIQNQANTRLFGDIIGAFDNSGGSSILPGNPHSA